MEHPAAEPDPAGVPGRLRGHLPGDDRPDRRQRHLLHQSGRSTVRRAGWCCRLSSAMVAAIMAAPAEVVGRCFAHLKAARGIPIRPTGIARRHRAVLGPVLPACSFGRVGSHRRRCASSSCSERRIASSRSRPAAHSWRYLLIECVRPGISWSPYYKVKTEDLTRRTTPSVVQHLGERHSRISRSGTASSGSPLSLSTACRTPISTGSRSTTSSSWEQAPGPTSLSRSRRARSTSTRSTSTRASSQIGAERQPESALSGPAGHQVRRRRPRLPVVEHRREYDLILFALPDSLALVSGASQIRLESYLFTEEALRSARDHLDARTACSRCTTTTARTGSFDRLAGTVQISLRAPTVC